MRLVKLKNISVLYDERTILQNVNLEVNSGDFIGVIGPNGGGKTTLVKTILKETKYSGEVEYSSVLERNGQRRIGYLPQIISIDRDFPISVTDVVLSGLQSSKKLFGKYSEKDKKYARELLHQTNIVHLSSQPIGKLSGGEFQRVMLCRALISDPELLILDEPNNFVDNKFEGELYAILKELNKRMAIMIVSHDIGTITTYIKSVVCVNSTVHYHNSNTITPAQLISYNCPIQLIYHGEVPHMVLPKH